MHFSPDGRMIVASVGEHAYLWRLPEEHPVASFGLPEQARWSGAARFVGRAGNGLLLRHGHTMIAYQTPQGEQPLTRKQIEQAVVELGHEEFMRRERATERLIAAGPEVLGELPGRTPDDPEVRVRLRRVRNTLQQKATAYRMTGQLDPRKIVVGEPVVHPDREHWAAIVQEKGRRSVVIGILENEQLNILKEIPSSDYPETMHFDARGRLYVANGNGTVHIYAGEDLPDGAPIVLPEEPAGRQDPKPEDPAAQVNASMGVAPGLVGRPQRR
jgi:hypothetical protein